MPAGDVNTLATTYGSILLGTIFASGLTGLVFVQCILYYKLYPYDFLSTKALVFVVWAFDLMHTICIVITVWQCVITNYNKPENMDDMPSTLGLSIAVTAAITFMVHCSFANRIRMLMKRWYIAGPVVFLAFLRLLSACVSTSEIIRLKRFSLFIRPYPAWIFTIGLVLSASAELIIATTMIIFLGSRRTGFANMNHIINSLTLYTLETGSIICLVTIATLICWLLMPHNLIFLGMHFAIAKLYANSLLAMLNMRNRLRADHAHSSERGQNNGLNPLSPIHKSHYPNRIHGQTETQKSVQMGVNVETTVVSQIDMGHDEMGAPRPLPVFEAEHSMSLDRDSSDREDAKYPPFA